VGSTTNTSGERREPLGWISRRHRISGGSRVWENVDYGARMIQRARTVSAVLFVALASGAIGCTALGEKSKTNHARLTMISNRPVTEEAEKICGFGVIGVEEGLEAARAKREELDSIDPNNVKAESYHRLSQDLLNRIEELQLLSKSYGPSCISYRRCQIQSSRLKGVSCERERKDYDNVRDRLNTVHTEVLLLGRSVE
jgi:hypothetical protein